LSHASTVATGDYDCVVHKDPLFVKLSMNLAECIKLRQAVRYMHQYTLVAHLVSHAVGLIQFALRLSRNEFALSGS
jgi:hypothetical protein